MSFTKINNSDFIGNDVASAPDTLTGTTAQNKAIFDRAIKQVVTLAVNALIDQLELDGAGSIGAVVDGLIGSTVQQLLEDLKEYIDTHKDDTDNPHGVTAEQVGSTTASDVATAIFNALEDYYTKTATDTALSNKVDKVTDKGLSSNDFTNILLAKLNGIADQAQVNVIEVFKKNGIAQPIIDKAVDMSVPTDTADLTASDAMTNINTLMPFITNLYTAMPATSGSYGTSWQRLYQTNTSIKRATALPLTTNATDMSNTFNGCLNLERIDSINFTNCTATKLTDTFTGCTNLKNVTVVGTINAFATQRVFLNACIQLTKESVLSFFNALETADSGLTGTDIPIIRINTTVFNQLTSAEKAIATSKNWSLVNIA